MARKKIPAVIESLLSVIRFLTTSRIPFVVVGGAALALHGIPRATLDIDVVIPAKAEVILKLFYAAKEAGFLTQDKDIIRLVDKAYLLIGQWITFCDSGERELLDVLFEDIETFNRLRKQAVRKKAGKGSFYIASLDDLEAMKREVSRPIDMADIALIQERRKLR